MSERFESHKTRVTKQAIKIRNEKHGRMTLSPNSMWH